MSPNISVVILTYQRAKEIERNVSELLSLSYGNLELIVVNNGYPSEVEHLPRESERLRIINLDQNLGVGARNVGIQESKGEFVVTLDDDVFGFSDEAIRLLIEKFAACQDLAAINFKVIDDVTEQQMNWIHHRKIEDFHAKEFDTYEISEGAVAFRREAILKTSLYPEFYFISHEGPDLALQIMKLGDRIIYCPDVVVRHSHAEGGRSSWRRYYYDTRNQIWIAVRHYPVGIAIRKLFVGLGSMAVYAVRDGFTRYYLKGVRDGVLGLKSARRHRDPLVGEAKRRYRMLESHNPSFWYMLKRRIVTRKIKI